MSYLGFLKSLKRSLKVTRYAVPSAIITFAESIKRFEELFLCFNCTNRVV